ncbi:hypothetical protein [uncultured Brachyspira sp.]|uniref:hypothetical protein n=1 Tax=uncultured Brachyspira sp. TaxID=221953 RepID=UPI0025E42E61|nr:hypothetical protein [uncultured Brachyspira sp.]
MYKIISLDEKTKIIKLLYNNKSDDSNAMFSLMKYIKSKINAEMEQCEDGFLLFNDKKKYLFYIIENDAVYIKILNHDDKVAFLNFKYMEKEFKSYIEEMNLIILKEKIKNINDSIKDNMWLDFMISEYGNDLHIIAGNDLSCCHILEVIFKNACFVQCSKYFNACPNEYDVFYAASNYDIDDIKDYKNINKYSAVIKIKSDDAKNYFYIVCDGIEFIYKEVRYDYDFTSLYTIDKENIIKKYNLKKESDGWYQEKENSHKTLIFTDKFFNRNDTIGILFRIYKLCFAKVKYFRTYIFNFEPYKYDYKNGFIQTELWDAEFFRHIDSGYMIDLRFLQSITLYEDFISFCKELESFEK